MEMLSFFNDIKLYQWFSLLHFLYCIIALPLIFMIIRYIVSIIQYNTYVNDTIWNLGSLQHLTDQHPVFNAIRNYLYLNKTDYYVWYDVNKNKTMFTLYFNAEDANIEKKCTVYIWRDNYLFDLINTLLYDISISVIDYDDYKYNYSSDKTEISNVTNVSSPKFTQKKIETNYNTIDQLTPTEPITQWQWCQSTTTPINTVQTTESQVTKSNINNKRKVKRKSRRL